MPAWVAAESGVPKTFVSVPLVVNTVLTVVFQVRVGRGAGPLAGGARFLRVAGTCRLRRRA
jgi:hypothetical protein